MSSSETYSFAPGVTVRVAGDRAASRHFAAEYGEARAAAEPDVEVEFGDVAGRSLRGGHKTVRWAVDLSPPSARPLAAAIRLRGRPRSFGFSLVQGYLVEPLLAVAAARAGRVLVPSAAIADDDGGALLLLGRSRSGKSTVSARAVANGRPLLGDDQVLVDATGACSPFPRRLRFYTDLADTAPAAYARLPPRVRRGLRLRKLLRVATRGYAAPPVRVRAAELGPSRAASLPLARIVLIERGGTADRLEASDVATDALVGAATDILTEQRGRLVRAGRAWEEAHEETLAREAEILDRAFAARRAERLLVPAAWSAPRAIAALADYLQLEPAA